MGGTISKAKNYYFGKSSNKEDSAAGAADMTDDRYTIDAATGGPTSIIPTPSPTFMNDTKRKSCKIPRSNKAIL